MYIYNVLESSTEQTDSFVLRQFFNEVHVQVMSVFISI